MTIASKPSTDPPDTVLSIQYLRGAAALGVVASHAAHGTFEIGASGVDVFFVISGFIMWGVTAKRRQTPGQFLKARAIRVAPPYLGLTLLVALGIVLLPGLFNHAVLTPRHLLLSLLFIPHHDPYGSLFPVLIPGWTLTYEMYFYGLFGLGLASPRRWRGMAICGALLALVGAGALFGPFDFAAATTYTSPLLLEFAAGIVLARWRLSTRLGVPALLAGLVALACWQWLVGVPSPNGMLRLLVWGLPAALLVAGALSLETALRAKPLALPLRLGGASYGIYLTHVFVLAALFKLGLPDDGWTLAIPAGLAASALAGTAWWKLVEVPLTRLARRVI